MSPRSVVQGTTRKKEDGNATRGVHKKGGGGGVEETSGGKRRRSAIKAACF